MSTLSLKKVKKKLYLEHQTLGQRFIYLIVPATQPNILEIDEFLTSLQYCLPSHVCLLGGTKSSLGMTSRHHEAVNKQEKELVHYY